MGFRQNMVRRHRGFWRPEMKTPTLWSRIVALFGSIAFDEKRKRSPVPEPAPPTRKDRILKRLMEQSYARYLALQCTHPTESPLPEDFDESSDASLALSMRRHLERHYETALRQMDSPDSDFWIAIVASGLLVYGRLDMVEVILDRIRVESYRTDHYAGQCNLLPYLAISKALPIPRQICECDRAGGGVKTAAARDWFRCNRSRLKWNEEMRRFVLAEMGESPRMA